MRWLTLTLALLIRYSQLSVRMMEALNQTRPLAKPKERRGLNLAMQAFLDEELPRIEAARSTKVGANRHANPHPNRHPNPCPNRHPYLNPNPNPP